jgi:hypothetical protein
MTGTGIDRQGRGWRIAAGTCAVAVVLTSYAVAPVYLPLGPCIIKETTGVSCLSCGMTRSFHSIAHGEWMEAFRYHLFGPVFFAGIIILGGIAAGEGLAGRTLVPRPPSRLARRAVIVLGSAWLAYGIIRAVTELLR